MVVVQDVVYRLHVNVIVVITIVVHHLHATVTVMVMNRVNEFKAGNIQFPLFLVGECVAR